jgi:uncharacterized membrane protein
MRSRGSVRSRATGFVAAVLVLLSSVAFVVPDGKAVVTGGVVPCSGLDLPNGPHYAAGLVTVLRGKVTWISTDQGNIANVFPSGVVAQQSVGTNAMYRFVLEPGQYVLQAGYGYASVTLQPGDDLRIDIPDMCI